MVKIDPHHREKIDFLRSILAHVEPSLNLIFSPAFVHSNT